MVNPQFLVIRLERPGDDEPIRRVHEAAFGGRTEADLVESLHSGGHVLLSVVAELNGLIAGHALFSRMWIDTSLEAVDVAALAPMAVLPQYQRQGIGTRVIAQGIDALRARGERIVIVVGHPAYYPRFGFSSAKASGLEGPFPAEAFMALDLAPGALNQIRGRVRYPSPFGL